MNEQYPWRFEECENEVPVCDPAGQPWRHAVRGRKPAGRLVMGYGHHPDDAERDATHKAHQQDAREVLGERGEVKLNWQILDPDGMVIIDHLEKFCEPLTFRTSMGEGRPIYDMPLMPIGT